MKVSDLYPSKYLRASDLAGHTVAVTIQHIVLEPFYDQASKDTIKKPVLYFEGKQKGLVLSKSLAYKIAELLGTEEMDQWKGKEIVIFSEKKTIFGNIKDVFSAGLKKQGF